MDHHEALAEAKREAERIPPERREKLNAAFDTAARAAQVHSEFQR